jgi:hypothetical protein
MSVARAVHLLSHMFAKAVEWKWRTENPCKGVQRFHEDKREAWMSVEQIERLGRACDGYADQDAADAIRHAAVLRASSGTTLGRTKGGCAFREGSRSCRSSR